MQNKLFVWHTKKYKRYMNEYKKDFDAWHMEKKQLNDSERNIRFAEREIWWCKVGVNIGFEIDGKKEFKRPVLILKKMSHDTFIGLPLTKKTKDTIKEKGLEKFYFKLGEIKEKNTDNIKDDLVSLQQFRFFDKRRLIVRKYKMRENKFNELKEKLSELLL